MPVPLLLDDGDVLTIRRRVERYKWAAATRDQLLGRLEAMRRDLLNHDGAPPTHLNEGGRRATVLFELALCSRLAESWHRDAALRIIEQVTDLPAYVGHFLDPDSGFDYGLNGLMIAKAVLPTCLALDVLGEIPDPLRQRLYEKVLVPIARRLADEVPRGGSNWQVQENLALLCVGLAAEQPEFIRIVTDDPKRSYVYHLANSVHPDGLWFEQSFGYHVYALQNLLLIRRIAGRHGIAMGGDDVLRRMVGVLFRAALPDGELPRLADTSDMTFSDTPDQIFRNPSGVLELAYAQYSDPLVGWALARSARRTVEALLFGEEIRHAEVPPVRSELLPESGIAVLKIGQAPAYWEGQGQGVTITFGPHGDWHGHPAKLGIEFWHNRDYLVRDRGKGTHYALPMHRQWFATTVAHSTVVVDGRNQSFTFTNDRPELEKNERGICHAHLLRPDAAACTVSADFAYPGCRCRRTLFLTAEYLLDLFECRALDGRPRTFDWFCHTEGLVDLSLPTAPQSLEFLSNGYDYIRRPEAGETDADWSAAVRHCTYCDSKAIPGAAAMRLHMTGVPGTVVFKGWCPEAARDRWSPVVIARRRTAQTLFAALYVPARVELALDCEARGEGTIICRIGGGATFEDLLIKQDRKGAIEAAGWRTNEQLGYQRRQPS